MLNFALLFVLALLAGTSPLFASGVERGVMPAEMHPLSGIPQEIQTRAEEVIRARCDLNGVYRVQTQNFRVFPNGATPELGRFEKYVIEYEADYSEVPLARRIVVEALRLRDSGEVVIKGATSAICR